MILPDYSKWGLAETNNPKEAINIQAMTKEAQHKALNTFLFSFNNLDNHATFR